MGGGLALETTVGVCLTFTNYNFTLIELHNKFLFKLSAAFRQQKGEMNMESGYCVGAENSV